MVEGYMAPVQAMAAQCPLHLGNKPVRQAASNRQQRPHSTVEPRGRVPWLHASRTPKSEDNLAAHLDRAPMAAPNR